MYCGQCGKKIKDDSNFCIYCGAKVKKDLVIDEPSIIDKIEKDNLNTEEKNIKKEKENHPESAEQKKVIEEAKEASSPSEEDKLTKTVTPINEEDNASTSSSTDNADPTYPKSTKYIKQTEESIDVEGFSVGKVNLVKGVALILAIYWGLYLIGSVFGIIGSFVSIFMNFGFSIFNFWFVDSIVSWFFSFVKILAIIILEVSLVIMVLSLDRKKLSSFVLVTSVSGIAYLGLCVFSAFWHIFTASAFYGYSNPLHVVLVLGDFAKLIPMIISVGILFGVSYIYDNSIVNRLKEASENTTETIEKIKEDYMSAINDTTGTTQTTVRKTINGAVEPSVNKNTNSNVREETKVYTSNRLIATNRGLLKYVLLTFITCNFYHFFFVHNLAKDINEICKDDHKKTSGVFKYIIFSFITCGIYPFFWIYNVANRIADYADNNGVRIREDGTTIILWRLFGMFVCCIGPFVATHLLCKNMNTVAEIYNSKLSEE